MNFPTLTTARLTLRGFVPEDFDGFAAFYADDRSRFVGGVKTRNEAWRQFGLEFGHWHLRGYGNFAVTETATGKLAGYAGPWNPEGWPEPELGWSLFAGFEGKGYATEAARAVRDWAYADCGWTTAISLVDPSNAGSAKVCTRLGAWHESDMDHPMFGALQIWRHPSAVDLAKGVA
ncbi:GNAT family N-acetyltransferase [Fluviibacterium sp. S390]|uniref:GNAT family N-acetyltransferase n=1 Tax=Fluviibacterium sp. S390 TaxID=3415139 RepID=UPI003C7EC989